jgi:hypothetical protein
MASFTASYWHWLVMLMCMAVVIFPVWKILTRTGNSGWWSLLAVVPFVNLLLLYGLAFGSWPLERVALDRASD